MIRKNGIFLQTFIWFWIVMMVIVATLFTLHWIMETTLVKIHERKIAPLTYIAQIILERYTHGDVEGMTNVLVRMKSSRGIETYLFDDRGVEVTGRVAPPDVASLAARASKDENVAVVTSLYKKGMAAMTAYSADKRRYVVVTSLPDRPPPFILDGIHLLVLSFIVFFIIVSIACYLLSRRMTKPIVKLREATKRLASGDLTVRVIPAVGMRQDEIGGLAQDFDIMSERVENLLTSQRLLLGNISHELRSPLARIRVAVDLTRLYSSDQTEQILNRIDLETERLNELIGRLLTFSRLESNTGDLKKESFSLEEVINEVAADANFEAQSEGKTVRVSESIICVVSGVRDLFRSALENVVRNAVRYTKEGTEVEISLCCATSDAVPSVIIIVRDYGPGVPQGDLEKIFQPFYRVSSGRERRTGNTGLGLAITKMAIRLHDGSVKAINAPDGGLIIEMTIPHTSTAFCLSV